VFSAVAAKRTSALKMILAPKVRPEKVPRSGLQSLAEQGCEGLGSRCTGSRFAWLAKNLPVTDTVRPRAGVLVPT
jgi:hypothetical protein